MPSLVISEVSQLLSFNFKFNFHTCRKFKHAEFIMIKIEESIYVVCTRLVVILPTMYLYFSFEVGISTLVKCTYACIMSNFLQSGDDLIDQAIPLILTVGET